MSTSWQRGRVPLLAALTVLSLIGVALVTILSVAVRTGAELREEAAEAILLADMDAHLQRTAAYVDALAAGVGESVQGSHDQLDDHPDLMASIGGFSATGAEIAPLLDEPNKAILQEITAIHNRYAQSVYDLHALESIGADLMPVYHGETEELERQIREALLEVRLHESEEIHESIARSVNSETLMLWLVPTLFVVALSIALHALWLQDSRRKHTIATLRESNAEKDRFLATVSHELRTPLTSVLGFIEILTSEGEPYSPDARREMLQLASREAWELSNLVEDLLVMARADTGPLSMVDVAIDLKAQAAQVVEGMDVASRVRVECDAARTARGDPARARQIIRNLLTNAFQYGGDDIRIHLEGHDHEIRLRVIDNGSGIPEIEQLKIFEPYHRAHLAGTPVGSVGLGLAVSRQLAQAMGGNVTYRYESGHSVFELTLPRDAPSPTALESRLSSTPA